MNIDKNEQNVITASFKNVLSTDIAVAEKARTEIVQAIEQPLRRTLLTGDTIGGVYTPMDFTDNPNVEFQLDLLTPGQEKEFAAFTLPNVGRIPQAIVEGDYLRVPTYYVGNSIDTSLRFIRNANWPVIQRMLEVLEAGFRKKLNDDGWQVVLAAATDRNIVVADPNAAIGQLTPRLITLMSTFMRRNGGGNSGTSGRSKLTDVFASPEALMDIRSWGLDLIPDSQRQQYFNTGGDIDEINVFGVKLHALDELGEGQDYQSYYTTTLSGVMGASDVEIAVGLDLSKQNSFIMPIREDLQIVEDNTMHRKGLFSLYGRMELGFACLDSRTCLISSL
jgi:hypothetical protein